MSARLTQWCYLEPQRLWRLLGARAADIGRVQRSLEEYLGRPVVLLNAARTGIHLALRACGIGRTDEIWVPPYLSQCVLNTITQAAIPSLHCSPRARAMLVVHQWGYPQRMEELAAIARERGLMIIEDCAYSLGSTYRGRRIGEFGDAAVFSFPKMFPTILGGCLVSGQEDLLRFARAYVAEKRSFSWRLFSTAALIPMAMTLGTRDGRVNGFFRHINEACYSQYVYAPQPNKRAYRLFPDPSRMQAAFAARRRNLSVFREHFVGRSYFADLEAESDVVPYVVPCFVPDAALATVVAVLRRRSVETDVYHFDVARNMAAADYRKCVAVPVHQGISEERMNEICETIATAAGTSGRVRSAAAGQ